MTINLEEQYKLFLKRMALNERRMHPVQKVQLKQTFYGAIGQLLVIQRDVLSELDEQTAVYALQDMIEQIDAFFQNELNN